MLNKCPDLFVFCLVTDLVTSSNNVSTVLLLLPVLAYFSGDHRRLSWVHECLRKKNFYGLMVQDIFIGWTPSCHRPESVETPKLEVSFNSYTSWKLTENYRLHRMSTDLYEFSSCWQVPPLRQESGVQRSNVSALHLQCASTYAVTPTRAVLLALTTRGESLTTRTLLQPDDDWHRWLPEEHSSTGTATTFSPRSASIYKHTQL